ncbi:hypothetical protein SCATT_04840 [Streptantibioticus cattleyicolor NRRL 8057 = DSM 46488]|uniref:Uncharacterized protein n=1 Tax=Streptantibioticus cattleyicolor (strain ATCC 35852 / DSM 46488 / JCM 4925 / NBRC 14057 / NRRL 8057) TaxID=1003195 RepID=F8JQW6_STREN|nr:hypothetical protein SCATT_04840 [Streptantibioticus cattleyicolor NRRL 8057 = DSM 46488]MYS57610.1 hypothetical protein [Streptomyces sp. SID5468]CCB73209.1 protein of unknown function [Streptantibioticus cattleyicolor NRRL 8057 = DSM 46488]
MTQPPPVCGLVINPRDKSPLYVAAEERDDVLAAAVPFPAGARVWIRTKTREPEGLLAAALPRPDERGAVPGLAGTAAGSGRRWLAVDQRLR